MGNLTKNFSREEFKCPDCGQYDMDEGLITILQNAREEFRDVIHITSGYRCKQRNKDVGGGDSSMHLQGKAVDIYITDNSMRYKLVQLLYKHGITRIYIYSGHIHVDIKQVNMKILGHGK